ncbi:MULTISPECIES: aldehyde dehydrogenase family protein [unclassified Modicisalibacter]|uniref:aldehyde dehydrogenase family protein n=1 Tax=unclassified Modicisalibacter TaxID=2679913 RepID=UPI001CCC9CF9|nr:MULTISPECIES: aldehyde dehydrogenase family protein [unclassified Modicisalibacter]MBZ9559493.1 aldehyde dehydrogenase family protein [Modicisalibacter sp. R2A 31.J]MBZ9576945.1 aldehyde dehydrogenase family protein [Modicisalibacter sp. MOD 31.J]
MNYDRHELQRVLDLQRASFIEQGGGSVAQRRSRVSKMALALLENMDALADTLSADYGSRPAVLTKALEGLGWVQDIGQTLSNLPQWMESREVPGGFVQAKPKGVVGIMGAWNFPLTLTFHPAMLALATGNRVMLNFPEYHQRTGKLLREIFSKQFDESEVCVFNGDLGTAQAFSALPLDHLFFTGSPSIGKVVAQAAGKNLVPITLELGGKNPVVVADDVDLDLATKRIASTRLLNGGQVCLCPDYVFVPERQFDEFVENLKAELQNLSGDLLKNPAFVPIINDNNFDRIISLIDDAVAKGAKKIVASNESQHDLSPNRATRRIPPTLLIDTPETARINSEEIFGPVLVLKPYGTLSEVISYINAHPSPLAAYWYGEDTSGFRRFLDGTNSGGVTRNDGFVHASLPDAPFGGVGRSGFGAYHGRAGFDTFTHYRTVANSVGEQGTADAFVDGAMLDSNAQADIDGAVATAVAAFKDNVSH